MPKILLLDIETFPNLVYVWGSYKQNVLAVKEHTIVCSYSAKWLDGKQTTRTLYDFPGYTPKKRDDTKLIQELWVLVDEADIIVAHYGDGFDVPTLKASFMRTGLLPPTPFKTVDTKKVASKYFYFGGSYTLDNIVQYLGLGKKLPTGGFDLWAKCMEGDPAAWARMKKYNAHDVVILEKLYLYMLPWISDHPSVFGSKQCPKCGSSSLQSRGMARTNTRQYRRFQCQDCGGWLRAAKSDSSIPIVSI